MGKVIYNPFDTDRKRTFIDINGNKSEEPISSLGQKTNPSTLRNYKRVVRPETEREGGNEEEKVDPGK